MPYSLIHLFTYSCFHFFILVHLSLTPSIYPSLPPFSLHSSLSRCSLINPPFSPHSCIHSFTCTIHLLSHSSINPTTQLHPCAHCIHQINTSIDSTMHRFSHSHINIFSFTHLSSELWPVHSVIHLLNQLFLRPFNHFFNHHFIHSLYHLFPWHYNHSLNHQFIHLHFHFTEIHSFIPSFTPLTRHSLISSFPLRCRLDVLLAFYLDKGSCAELAEVGLEALQYPGRVWPGEPGPYRSRALLLDKGRFQKPFRTWRSFVWSLHSVAIGYSPVGM